MQKHVELSTRCRGRFWFSIRSGCCCRLVGSNRFPTSSHPADGNVCGTYEAVLNRPVFRSAPGCEMGCPECEVMCAVLTRMRDEAWRSLETACRERGLSPGTAADDRVRLRRARLGAAERTFSRFLRERRPDRAVATSPETFAPMRLH